MNKQIKSNFKQIKILEAKKKYFEYMLKNMSKIGDMDIYEITNNTMIKSDLWYNIEDKINNLQMEINNLKNRIKSNL